MPDIDMDGREGREWTIGHGRKERKGWKGMDIERRERRWREGNGYEMKEMDIKRYEGSHGRVGTKGPKEGSHCVSDVRYKSDTRADRVLRIVNGREWT